MFPLFFNLFTILREKLFKIKNANDLIVKASGKKYVTSQGFELGIPAQVTSTETTTPLRMK
jgi:hypothetical protein